MGNIYNDPVMKITKEGQPCRKCGMAVKKKKHAANWMDNPKRRKQAYYFEYWYKCPRCHTVYFVEEAKRYWDSTQEISKEESIERFFNQQEEIQTQRDICGIEVKPVVWVPDADGLMPFDYYFTGEGLIQTHKEMAQAKAAYLKTKVA